MNAPGLYSSLFWRTTWRHWRGEAGQTVLLLLLLSLGVGAYFSVRLANRAAVGGFEQFHGAIQTQSDGLIRAPAGPLRTEDLRRIRLALGTLPAQLVPIVETTAVRAGFPSDPMNPAPTLRVIGLDLVQFSNLRSTGWNTLLTESARGENDGAEGFNRFLEDPSAVWLSPQRAEAWNLTLGDALPVILGDRVVDLTIRGWLPEASAQGEAPDYLAILDLPSLQALLDRPDTVDRLEVVLPPGPAKDAQLAALVATLADLPYRWLPPEGATSGEAMTAAFRLNLTILSLIALLVALYLITQALDAAVVRRRAEIATLRSLGFTPAMIRRAWLAELLMLGVIGGVGGLLLGWGLAQVTAGAVAQTVNALYFGVNEPSPVRPQGIDLLLALALGLGGSLLAGWLPLRDAAATPPAQVLAAGDFTPGFGLFRRHRLGWGLLAVGALGWFLPPLQLDGGARFPLAGYVTAFTWLFGGTLVLGVFFRLIAAGLRCVDSYSASLRLARARLSDPSSRHRLAAAGLFVALAMAASMSVLVGSFERTMTRWIEVRFQADVYASSLGLQSATADSRIRGETWRAIRDRPEVVAFDPFLLEPIEIDGISTFLGGSDLTLIGSHQEVLWLIPPSAPPRAGSAYVNEAFVERFRLGAGDSVVLPTPGLSQTVRIEGVFADYGNERGSLLIDYATFAEWWQTDEITNFSVFLAPGIDAAQWALALENEFPGLAVRDNATLRTAILKIFRQTFAITEALKYLGVIVALAGLGLAQLNLLRESRRELRAMRCLGATRQTIGLATAVECLGVGLVGLVGGLFLSLGLGALLIFVINKQSFGWTLQFALPLGELVVLAGSTLLACALVGYGVGHSAAKLQSENGTSA